MNKLCPQHTTESKVQLKTGGLKITGARLGLLEVFKHSKKPLSIKEIAKALGGKKVDLVTLYRNVEALQALGLVKQINLKDRQAYYELAAGAHHHHIVCTNCGKLADVKVREMSLNKALLKSSGFAKVTDHSLEFFGLCKSCAA